MGIVGVDTIGWGTMKKTATETTETTETTITTKIKKCFGTSFLFSTANFGKIFFRIIFCCILYLDRCMHALVHIFGF